ncbi:hypothetical protein [Pseudomonas sp. DSP3-2-3]|uniref:hypothetical protein n=2 Tax=unclassified Pseudomonas TaxID=196821 RepID=UPI003CEC426D
MDAGLTASTRFHLTLAAQNSPPCYQLVSKSEGASAMTQRIAIFSILAALAVSPVEASESFSGEQEFQCGKSTVRIGVDHQLPLYATEGAEVTLQVERNADKRFTLLRYTGGIDFIGATCDTDTRGNPRVVYQAICGGSGCKVLDNWGVIDPEWLNVLLAPSDDSLEPATKLLGHKPSLSGPLMSVSKVAHQYGLPTP